MSAEVVENISPEQIAPESVVFRYRPPLMDAARDYLKQEGVREKGEIGTADVEFFENCLEQVDREGVVNYDFFSPPDFPDVRIPFTRINVNKVYEQLTGRAAKPDPNAFQEKVVQFQAWALGELSTVADMWGEVYRNSAKALNRIAEAQAAGEAIPDVEIVSVGWAQGFTGKVTKEWLQAVKKDGFEHYGKQYAQFVTDAVVRSDAKPDITLTGYSAGTQVAYRTAEVLSQDENFEGKIQVKALAPVGFHEQNFPQQAIAALKIPAGFLGTSAWLVARGKLGKDPLFVKESEADKPFREKIRQFLGDRFNKPSQEEDKLKLAVAREDVKKLIAGTPYTEKIKGKVREIRGALDLVSFDKQSVQAREQGFKSFPSHGEQPHKFLIGAGGHYIDYNDLRVGRFLHLMHNIRTSQPSNKKAETVSGA